MKRDTTGFNPAFLLFTTKEVMVFLQSHGVSTTYAVKIYKQYGEQVIAIVTNNPYQLAADI
jgi:exodeoxyribonuclease V alpha subunit